MEVRRDEGHVRADGDVDLADAFRGMAEATRSVRLRLAWENSSWQTTLAPPAR